MLKNVIVKLANNIQELSTKNFQRYLLLFLGGIATLIIAMIFYINNASLETIKQIKQLENLANKSVKVLSTYQKLQQDESNISEILEKDKEFSIRAYFEQFYKDQGVNPENWDTKTLEIGSDKFIEIELPVNFKGLTTDQVVKMLETLDKKKILKIKEVNLKSEGNRKISLELTLATIKAK